MTDQRSGGRRSNGAGSRSRGIDIVSLTFGTERKVLGGVPPSPAAVHGAADVRAAVLRLLL